MTIASLLVDVAANTAQLQEDVRKIHGQLDNVGNIAGKVGSMIAGAFTFTAITNAASEVMQYAGRITDLSTKTGLSTRAIQEMQHAATLTGTSIDAFTNAAFKLGTNLAGGGNSVEFAVRRLGLSYEDLRKLSPDEQFRTIASALGQVENAQERNSIAVEVFGKAAKDILPAIAQGYDDIAASAVVAGDEQLKALDAAGDAIDSFINGIKTIGVQTAGSIIMAVQSFDNLDRSVKKNTVSSWDWASALEAAGLKTQSFAKVTDAAVTAAKNVPATLAPVALSVSQIAAEEKKLTQQLSDRAEQTKKAEAALRKSHQVLADWNFEIDKVNASMLREMGTMADFTKAIEKHTERVAAAIIKEAMLRQEYDRTVASQRALFANMEQDAKRAMEQAEISQRILFANLETTAKQSVTNIGKAFTELPGVILNAIMGGGSVISAAGAHIGTSLMSRFHEKFGPAIAAALPFGIGNAINALLPTLGALFGPIAEKIGGFFRSIFGGPSADELRGRQAVADFEAQLHSTLNATQQLEAGQESWKKTVIAIRDAYLAVGLTEADALLAAERLWASSRNGAEASQKVIDEIKRIMEGGATAAAQFASHLDYATRNRTINIGFNVDEMPEVGVDLPGFSGGSNGIRDFGRGTPVMLHGRERVQTEAQMRAEQGGSNIDVLNRVDQTLQDLPRAMKIAFRDAIVLAGAGR